MLKTITVLLGVHEMLEFDRRSPYNIWENMLGLMADLCGWCYQWIEGMKRGFFDRDMSRNFLINMQNQAGFFPDNSDTMKRIYRDGSYENIGSLNHIFYPFNQRNCHHNLRYEYPIERAQEWLDYIEKALQTQSTQFYEYEEVIGDRITYKEAQLIPFNQQETVGIIRDITERKRMEKALEKSEEKYRQIVETATEGVWIIDREDQTTFVNNRMAEMLGYSVREILHRSFLDFTDEEGKTLAKTYMERRHQGIEESCDFKFICKDGSDLWVMISTSPSFDGNGKYAGTLGMVTDITKRKLAELALRKSEATNRALINTIPDAMFLINQGGIFLDIKVSQGCPFLSKKLLGQSLGDFFPPSVSQSAMRCIKIALETRRVQSFEYHLENQFIFFPETEVNHFFEARMIAVNEEEVLVMVRDITERKKVEETMRYQANYDSLTGLPNRLNFNASLEHLLKEAEVENHRLAVCFLDIDHFKRINDSLGHNVGDLLLRDFAQRLRESVRQSDIVSRWAGDEFTIIIPLDTPHQAGQIAQRVLDSLQPVFDLEGHHLQISSSIGIAIYPEDGIRAETLMKNADYALYYAKEQGRNNYQFYQQVLGAKTEDFLTLQNRVYETFETENFERFYQPKVKINSWEIMGIETLVFGGRNSGKIGVFKEG